MKLNALFFILIFLAGQVFAQETQVDFVIGKELKHTPVISQGGTGTCWSFATISFLESEILRKGFPETNLSEMYFVYQAYRQKSLSYLMYHGKSNFSQGGQAHDVLNVLKLFGMATYEALPGEKVDDRFDHTNLVNELNIEITRLNKERKNFDVTNIKSIESILDKYIGKIPSKIKTEDGNFAPIEFRNKFELNPDDYVELTSYNHHPFYEPFVLEVPDNWSNDLYYNLPIDELVEVMKFSLENGYTVCWDGDSSEKTFSHKNGIADLPEKQIGKVDQNLRQETFYDRTTTDDHLMHVVGLSKDENGRTGFYTKNSWGEKSNDFEGYLNLTEDYVRLKTIAILVHKNAIPESIKTKLGL